MLKRTHEKRNSKIGRILLSFVFGLIFFLASVIFSVSVWYQATFDMSFSDLLFTFLSPLKGTGENTLLQIFSACVLPVMFLMLFYVAVILFLFRKVKKRHWVRRLCAGLCVVSLLAAIVYSAFAFEIPAYLKRTFTPTELYETEYIDPDVVDITDNDGNAKNLICIYLESMETTYASQEMGGEQEENYIPQLTALAGENVSFSDGEGLGGFRSITGTGWTMGALMGTTSGVPFSLAIFGENSHNSQGKNGTFVNGLTTLGDILAEKGYTQEFLCGSDSNFAGRKTYFTVHGDYQIFDYDTAIEEGYIPKDRYVFWGLEDAILFEIAKDELTALADGDEPFHFSMLTVDPHHVGGYRCSLCGNEYESGLANVIACQDRQVSAFIEWCMAQNFYEDTTIVIIGDHPRMDNQLIPEGLNIYDRTMYNCILNAAVTPDADTKNRTFTSLDLFPTILAAMGFEIKGDRLGLGTNLFSFLPTLCERYGEGLDGYHILDAEVSKTSLYYKEKFVKNE